MWNTWEGGKVLKDKISNRQARIEVLGLGYIGLPTAILFAKAGFNVTGIDVNEKVVNAVNNGKTHIVEPDLDELVRRVIESNKFNVYPTPQRADVFLICVPTPITEDKKADLSYVKSAAKSLIPILEKENLVILESTVPPKTTENILIPVLEQSGLKAGKDIYVAHCPERVLPGKILREAVENDRIIGGVDEISTDLAAELYNTFVKGKIIKADATTAEMCKLVENTYRDINIAFANELSMLCDELGIDVWKLIEFANKHPRVNILQPGPGVGGHCIAVDPWFIVEKFPEGAKLIKTAREVNDAKPGWIVNKIEKMVESIDNANPTIGILGLTYKPDVDDIRESPSLKIVNSLISKGYEVKACDPYVNDNKVNFSLTGVDNIIEDCDIIVLLVDHKRFKESEVKEKIINSGKPILDMKGIFTKGVNNR